jgi:hypothetical protein
MTTQPATSSDAGGGTLTQEPAPDAGSGGVSLTDGAQGAPASEPATGIATSEFVYPENWRDGIAEEFRNDPTVQACADVPSMAKMLVHAQKQIGADKIPIPGKHATEQDWASVYSKLGLPASLDSYDVQFPEGPQFADEGIQKVLKENAHKAGILPKQLNALLAGFNEHATQSQEAQQKESERSLQEGLQSLQKEWGNAFNDEVNTARQAIRHVNDAQFMEWLNETGMANNPMMVKVFNKLGKLLKEDGIGSQGDSGRQTPKMVTEEINKIMADTSHPYHDANHPNHKAAVQEMMDLHTQANPEEPKPQIPMGF